MKVVLLPRTPSHPFLDPRQSETQFEIFELQIFREHLETVKDLGEERAEAKLNKMEAEIVKRLNEVLTEVILAGGVEVLAPINKEIVEQGRDINVLVAINPQLRAQRASQIRAKLRPYLTSDTKKFRKFMQVLKEHSGYRKEAYKEQIKVLKKKLSDLNEENQRLMNEADDLNQQLAEIEVENSMSKNNREKQ